MPVFRRELSPLEPLPDGNVHQAAERYQPPASGLWEPTLKGERMLERAVRDPMTPVLGRGTELLLSAAPATVPPLLLREHHTHVPHLRMFALVHSAWDPVCLKCITNTH